MLLRKRKPPTGTQQPANALQAPSSVKISRTGLAQVRTSPEFLQNQKNTLSTLSLDVLYEIFRAMHPADLLTLARMSKAFRNTLMSRTTEFIWKATHANVEFLPLIPCPPWMSEPELINLAFGQECYMCGKEANMQIRKRYFDCKGSCCFQCYPSVMSMGREKCTLDMSRFGRHMRPLELEKLLVKRRHHSRVPSFYKPHVDHLQSIVDGAKDEHECLDSLYAWKKEQIPLQEFAERLDRWWQTFERAQLDDSSIISRRRVAIVNNLRHLGYFKDLKLYQSRRHLRESFPQFCDRKQNLTPDEWSQMEPTLVAFMEERKMLLAKCDLANAIQARLASLDNALRVFPAQGDISLPCAIDLTGLDSVKAVLERPCDESVDEASLAELLPDAIAEWRKTAEAQLARFVSTRLKKARTVVAVQEPADLKDLAQVMFTCRCGAGLRWAGVLGHHHLHKTYGFSACTGPDTYGVIAPLKAEPFETAVRAEFLEKPWSPTSLRLKVCGARAENVFKAAGMDMASATCAEMDALDARIECVACGTAKRSMLVFDWREAIYHCEMAHTEKTPSALPWKLVDTGIAAKVKVISQSVTEDPPRNKINGHALVGAHPVWVFSDKLRLDDLSATEAKLFKKCGCWCSFPGNRTRQPVGTAALKRTRRSHQA